MNLSLERVLRFVAVAEQLSFTRAATLLGIDQPWLSRQVMQLEGQLGFPLFDRSGPSIVLTPAGVEFLEAAQDLAEAANRVRDKAAQMNRRAQSLLRVGMSYSTYPLEARERLLQGYAAVRPNVTLEYLAVELSEHVLQKLREDVIDFGIVFGPLNDPDLECCVLEVIDMSIAVPKEDPLAKASSVSLSDLAGRRIAVALANANSFAYKNNYAWIPEVGATPVHGPEGRRFIFDAAEKQRLFVTCYTPADKVPGSFVQLPVIGPKPKVNLSLVRSKRVVSPPGERLWRLAHELSIDPATRLEPLEN